MTHDAMLDEVLRFLRKNPESYIFLDVFCENRWGFQPNVLEALRSELIAQELIESQDGQPYCIRLTPKGYQYYGYKSQRRKKSKSWWSRLFASV